RLLLPNAAHLSAGTCFGECRGVRIRHPKGSFSLTLKLVLTGEVGLGVRLRRALLDERLLDSVRTPGGTGRRFWLSWLQLRELCSRRNFRSASRSDSSSSS